MPPGETKKREWLARAASRHASAAGLWIVAFVLVLFGSGAVFALHEWLGEKAVYIVASSGGTAGAVIALVGKGSKTAATWNERAKSWTDFSRNTLLAVGTVVFVVCTIGLDLGRNRLFRAHRPAF